MADLRAERREGWWVWWAVGGMLSVAALVTFFWFLVATCYGHPRGEVMWAGLCFACNSFLLGAWRFDR